MQVGNATAIKSAEALYTALGDYKDAASLYQDAHYRRAALSAQAGDYAAAIGMYDSLGAYLDSAKRSQATQYDWAKKLMDELSYDSAREKLLALGDYRDAAALADDCLFLPALAHPC